MKKSILMFVLILSTTMAWADHRLFSVKDHNGDIMKVYEEELLRVFVEYEKMLHPKFEKMTFNGDGTLNIIGPKFFYDGEYVGIDATTDPDLVCEYLGYGKKTLIKTRGPRGEDHAVVTLTEGYLISKVGKAGCYSYDWKNGGKTGGQRGHHSGHYGPDVISVITCLIK